MIDIELINSFMAFLTLILVVFIIIFILSKKDIFKARLFLSEDKLVKLFVLFVISMGIFSLRELYDIYYGHSFKSELLESLFILLILIATILGYTIILPKQNILKKKSK
jgi:hypothetical protein